MSGQKERPILFSTPLIPRVFDGSKTQTRRILRVPEWADEHAMATLACQGPAATGIALFKDGRPAKRLTSPYGFCGDSLWVQEAHRLVDHDAESRSVIVEYASDKTRAHVYLTEAENEKLDARTSPLTRPMPGRFMYRSLSRQSLEVLSVRVERVQEISEADAIAEGISIAPILPGTGDPDFEVRRKPRAHFASLWDRINGKRASWASNPWVWVVTFRRLESAKAVA